MLLFSKTLYGIYFLSAELGIFLIVLLSLYSIFNSKYFKTPYNFLLILIIGSAFFEIFSIVIKSIGIHNNHFVNHPYSIFAIVVSSVFFNKVIQTKSIFYVSIISVISFIVLDIIQLFSPDGLLESPKYFTILSLLITLLSVMLQTLLLRSGKIRTLKNEPIFWFNLGFIVMNLSAIIMQPIFNFVLSISDDLAFIAGTIKNLADPITYTLWAIGVYKLRTQPFRPIASLWP